MRRTRLITLDSFPIVKMATREGRAELAKLPPLPVPSPTREFLAAGLLPYFGFPPDRWSMTPAHQLELIDRHPGLYRCASDAPTQRANPFAREGFACGDGWFGILERLSAKLVEDPYLIVSQCKEKFGLLRIYFHSESGSPAPDPQIDARLDAALEAAVEESKRTCELCGQPGEYLTDHKCVKVLCAACVALEEDRADRL
jgi:hypothetical protein